MGLRLPVCPEDVPDPVFGPGEHVFREYRMASGHRMVVEFPGPAYHPRMGATTPTHPVVGAVAWRWVAPDQPWRELSGEERERANSMVERTREDVNRDRWERQLLRERGTLFDGGDEDA